MQSNQMTEDWVANLWTQLQQLLCEVSRTAGGNASEDAQVKKATNKQLPRTKKKLERNGH
jgi:hypothetical protein